MRLLETVGELYCGLRGHAMLMQSARNRVFLRCASCGHESPGWALTESRPRLSFKGDARRFVLRRPEMHVARRVA